MTTTPRNEAGDWNVKNINLTVDEKKQTLTIVVDLKQRHGVSVSGKTVTIASTEGNQKIGHSDIAMGLTVYTKEGLQEELKKAGRAA